MKRILLFILPVILLLIAGCNNNPGPTSPADTEVVADTGYAAPDNVAVTPDAQGDWTFSLSYIDMPENFGTVKRIAASGSSLFVAGQGLETEGGTPVLCLYDTNTKEMTPLEFAYAPSDAEYIFSMCSGDDGEVYILAGKKPPDYTSEEEVNANDDSPDQYCILRYAHGGSLIEKLPLNSEGVTNPLGILMDKNSNIVCWSRESIVVFGEDGAQRFALSRQNGEILSVINIQGEINALVVENRKNLLCGIDMNTGTWGEDIHVDKDFYAGLIFGYTDCSGADAYISSGNDMLVYNEESMTFDLVFSWTDLGVPGTDVVSFAEISSNFYACVFRGESRVAAIEYKENKCQVIKLVTQRLIPGTQDLISRFNRENLDYKIEVEYIDLEAGDDLKLVTEIIAGNGPDIFDLGDHRTSLDGLSNNFLDLSLFIESSGYELVPSVQAALEREGKMYFLPDSFSIFTFCAEESLVGDRISWTTDEMNEIFAGSSKEDKFEGWLNKTEFLKWVYTFAMPSFVDDVAGTCRFDSEEFINQLKLCNERPANEEYDYSPSDTLLRVDSIDNFSRPGVISQNFRGDYSYIGFPNDVGCGSLFEFRNLRFAVSEQSAHIEAALKFLELLLSDEHQETLEVGLPIEQSAFDKKLDEAISGKRPLLRRKDAGKLTALLGSITIACKTDDTIWQIIEEETAPYFLGQKTAEQVAGIIQSRASIYLSERQW